MEIENTLNEDKQKHSRSTNSSSSSSGSSSSSSSSSNSDTDSSTSSSNSSSSSSSSSTSSSSSSSTSSSDNEEDNINNKSNKIITAPAYNREALEEKLRQIQRKQELYLHSTVKRSYPRGGGAGSSNTLATANRLNNFYKNNRRGRARGNLTRINYNKNIKNDLTSDKSSNKTNVTKKVDNKPIQQQQQQQHKNEEAQPKIAPLKLVLKRAYDNNYQIKTENANKGNRPRREAAQKVKFTFSDDEQEPTSSASSSFYNLNELKRHQQLQQQQQGPLAKHPRLQLPLNKSHLQQRDYHQQTIKRIDNQIKPQYVTEPSPPPKVELFYSKEINVKITNEEKLEIINKQPNVLVNHSKPFPLALCEETTNVVYTKALLLIHLFQSYTSQCILCPLCKKFLNVYEFTRHLHNVKDLYNQNLSESLLSLSSDDEDDLKNPSKNNNNNRSEQSYLNAILKNKTFNILPYQTANSHLTQLDMKIWKIFAKRYTQFKQERLLKRDKQKQLNKPIMSQMKRSKTLLQTTNEYLLNGLNNWDYITKSKNIYILDKARLEKENCIIIDTNETVTTTTANILTPPSSFNHQTSTKEPLKRKLKDDLVLSEDEEENFDNNSSIEPKNKHKKLSTSSSNSSLSIINTNDVLPSMQKRYFNLYDNLSFEILLYICDNQYTIIPTSYIEYINSKREEIFLHNQNNRQNNPASFYTDSSLIKL